MEKNSDEVVQHFFYHTSGVDVEGKKPAVDAPVSEKEVRKDAREALDHLRTLFQLLLTNSEVRKLLSDLQLIGRAMFADAASTVADRARPPQEALDQVDEATPTNKFAESPSPKRKTVPTDSKPKTEVAVSATGPPPGSPVSDAIRDSTNETSSAPAKKTFRSRFQGLANRVPDKHKERANTELENSKQYLKEQFPKERRDQFVYRLKKVRTSMIDLACKYKPKPGFPGRRRMPISPIISRVTFLVPVSAGDILRSWQARCFNWCQSDFVPLYRPYAHPSRV